MLVLQAGTLPLGMAVYQQAVDWSMPAQSLEAFGGWTAPVSLGAALLWVLAMRWAGLFVTGMLLWLLLSRLPSAPLGLGLFAAALALEYRWYAAYGVNNALYALGNLNLFHFLALDRAAGRYRNYNLFGAPVGERPALSAGLIAGAAALTALAVLLARTCRRSGGRGPVSGWVRQAGEVLRSWRPPLPLWVYESRKVLWYCGGLAVLLAAVLAAGALEPPLSRQGQQEALLSQYARRYAGPLSPRTAGEIDSALVQARREYEDADNDDGGMEYRRAKCWALEELAARYAALTALEAAGEENLWLLDQEPYERIYGGTGRSLRLAEASAALLALCLTIPGLFSLEKQGGIRTALLCAAGGRGALWRKKAAVAIGLSLAVWLIWTLGELRLLWNLLEDTAGWEASALSLSGWDGALSGGSLERCLAAVYGRRLLALLAAAGLVSALSASAASFAAPALGGAMALIAPSWLALLGARWLEPVSFALLAAGDKLGIGRGGAIWLAVCAVLGGGGLWLSARQWRRYSA